jgi:hypothetical protein
MLNFRQNKGSICQAWVVICRWRGRTTTAEAAHFILDEVKTMANSIIAKIRDDSCLPFFQPMAAFQNTRPLLFCSYSNNGRFGGL